MAVDYLQGSARFNQLQDYEEHVFDHPILKKRFESESRQIDACDCAMIEESYRSFSAIIQNDAICLIWARAFARLEPPEEPPPDVDHLADRHHRQQSCMVLAKRGIHLLSDDEEAAAAALVRACSKVFLFFRGAYKVLDFLWARMPPEGPAWFHEYQLAPDPSFIGTVPPRSCWSLDDKWSPDDWPYSYWGSWDIGKTVVAGILDSASGFRLSKSGGYVYSRRPLEYLEKGDWDGARLSIQDSVESPIVQPLAGCSSRSSSSEQYQDWDEALADARRPSVLANLMRAIDPFVVVDTSEWIEGSPTRWRRGARSRHYERLFDLACEFGKRWHIEVFLENQERFSEHYANEDFRNRIYYRAVNNENDPSVLIPILEQARLHSKGFSAPEAPVPRRLLNFAACPAEIFARIGDCLPNKKWRFYTGNHLILACVGRSLDLARYLVERAEEKALQLLPLDATEEERCFAKASAASQLVNRRGTALAPEGTPAEIAMKRGSIDLVQFLCSKGAEVTIALQRQALSQGILQMNVYIERWREAQEAVREQADLLQRGAAISAEQLREMSALHIAYQNQLKELHAVENDFKEGVSEYQKILEEARGLVSQLQQYSRLQQDAPKKVVEHFYP